MANDLLYVAATGGNYYGVVQSNPFNQFANGNSLENFNSAHWASGYAITLLDNNTLGQYFGTFPNLSAGSYRLFYYHRLGGSPATSDAPAASQQLMYWDGSRLYTDSNPFLATNQGDIAFNGFTIGGQDVATSAQIIIDHGAGPYGGSAIIGGAFASSFTFNDTNGSLITASPFLASITNGVITENHTTSNFTTSLGIGTFSIAALAPGYTFTPTTFTVGGAGSNVFQMTQIVHSVPTPGAGQVLAQGYLRDSGGNIIANGSVGYSMLIIPNGTGNGFNTNPLIANSGVDGYFSFLAWTGSYLSMRAISTENWTNSELVPNVDFWLENFK